MSASKMCACLPLTCMHLHMCMHAASLPLMLVAILTVCVQCAWQAQWVSLPSLVSFFGATVVRTKINNYLSVMGKNLLAQIDQIEGEAEKTGPDPSAAETVDAAAAANTASAADTFDEDETQESSFVV